MRKKFIKPQMTLSPVTPDTQILSNSTPPGYGGGSDETPQTREYNPTDQVQDVNVWHQWDEFTY